MNPTSKPLTVSLGNKRHTLHFDLNTFSAFEDVTGRFFLDFLGGIQEAMSKARNDALEAAGKNLPPDSMGALRMISLRDFRALIWAALHTYNVDDEPEWPYTLNQIGRMLDVEAMARLLPQVLTGGAQNLPDEADVKEESAARPIEPKAGESSPRENGGGTSGPSDAEILESLTHSSDG